MEKNSKRIILTGGGTAGHITPNLALLPFLTEYEVHYVGCPNSMEEELVKKYPQVTFHALECSKLVRKLTLKNLAVPLRMIKAKSKAKKLLKEIAPSVIFSKGGYVSLPVMMAAKNIPLILHESDFSMGLANRLVASKCTKVCTSFFELSKSFKNGICTGSPIRQDLFSGNKLAAISECGLDGGNRKNLLIMGGSLGSSAINSVVKDSLNELCLDFNVVHITGKNNKAQTVRANYFRLPFSKNIADYFAWADYCVTRGGANALFELMALKKPSLIIPLPKGASRGDQLDNAKYFESLGCAMVLSQDTLCSQTLVSAIRALDNNKALLIENMTKLKNIDGTKTIANLIKSASK